MAPLTTEISAAGADRCGDKVARITWGCRLEYWAAAAILKLLGALPHGLARALCAMLAALSYWMWPRLRRVGMFNLRLAFPEWKERERRRVLFGVFGNLGRMLADFAHFPKLNRGNIERLIIYDGFENFARAHGQGKGCCFSPPILAIGN